MLATLLNTRKPAVLGHINSSPSVKRAFLNYKGRDLPVYGGPSRQLPVGTGFHFVKMAAEIDLPCDSAVNCIDFAVPDLDEVEMAIDDSLKALLRDGKTVVVGCMGGTGRTGTFLACLAKVVEDSPASQMNTVKFIRAHYKPHAVETRAQEDFVAAFNPDRLKKVARWYDIQGKVLRFLRLR